MSKKWMQSEELQQEYQQLKDREIFFKLFKYAFLHSVVLFLITIFILTFMLYYIGWTISLGYVLLAESGIVFLFGGIFGTTRMSISISKFNQFILKSDPINPITVKTAFNSVITYTLSGSLLFFYSALVTLI